LTAALRLVDERGVDALSMRRLAAALDIDPMTIYRHLPDKAALMRGLVALVFDELTLPPMPGASWQDQVRAFAHAYRTLARAHPHLLVYMITHAEAASNAALAAGEYLLAALEGAGLTPRRALLAADVIVDFLNGFALAESSGRLGQPGERRELLELLHGVPAHQYPALRRVLGALDEPEMMSDFDAGLNVILAGIEAA